jgi:hypothetical protein
MLYCFFVISHDRRRILHFGVTRRPTSAWVSQQLRETFPYDVAPKYLIFDRATNFGEEVVSTIKSFGIEPKRTSFRSHGRTASPNALSATAAETCLTMSSCSTSGI